MGESKEVKLSLADQLTSGMIDELEFLQAVNIREASDPNRTHAEDNIKLLSDARIKERLVDNPDTAWDYWNNLSLAFFHAAQHELQTGSLGQDLLSQAIEAAQNMNLEGDEDWLQYLRATQAYAQGDVEQLEALSGSILNERSARVARNLVDGLRDRGKINYAQDYNKN